MIKVAIKGLLGRKLRAFLTAFAVVLGVAMVSGTYVLTDTIKHGFDSIFTTAYGKADAVITGKIVFGNTNSVQPPSFPASVLGRVRALPAVARAVGGVSDSRTHLVGRNGKVISGHGAPDLGFSVDPQDDHSLNPLVLVQGAWPHGAHEIAIDAATARKYHYGIGDTIGVSVRGPTLQYRVSGITELGGVGSIGGATLSVFDLPTAQRIFHKQGVFDQIYVAAAPGTSPAKLVADLEPVLPPVAQVRTGAQEAQQQASDADQFTSLLQKFLLAFGFVALFVGSFVIANTLSITIAQRTRELATLRTIGATRRQVLRSVLLEALVVGAVASVVGLFLGLLLARGLNALFVSFGIDLPQNGTVFATRTVIVSVIVGVVVTVGASLRPAVRATRVPPIAAVREGSVLPPSRLERFGPFVAPVVGAIGLAGVLLGAFGAGSLTGTQRLVLLGIGVLLDFVAAAIFAPRLVKPLTVLVTPIGSVAVTVFQVVTFPRAYLWHLFSRHVLRHDHELAKPWPDRVVTDLAERNALRSPARTAASAAALMIGLALVTLVAVLAQGLKSSFESAVKAQFAADYALTSQNGFTPTDASSAEAVRRVPRATAVVGVRAGVAKVFGAQHSLTGLDAGASRVLHLKWAQGAQEALDHLGSTGAIVDKTFASSHHLSVGSPLTLLTPYGKRFDVHVKGIFSPPKNGSPLGVVTTSSSLFDRYYPVPQNVYVLIKTRGGVTAANTKLLDKATKGYPDAKVQTEQQFEKSQERGIDQLLNLLFVLLGFSIVISLFGIVNTLVLMVFERTRELGMLRAVGMTRSQVRRMIRQESVVTALIGAALGIPIGIALAVLVSHAIGFGVFAAPYGYLVTFVVAAILAGIVAAIFPARRAARLNVLAALQYE